MANQTITTSTNHDALTGRAAGESITIQQDAKLTIDSMPQHTSMGILGDIALTKGEVHIDGRYVREVAYASGSGTLPTIGTTVTWNSSAGSGKVIKLNSGNNAAGVMTITRLSGTNPTGTITDGTWSATVSTDKVGYLMVFGTDQVWDATDATCTIRVTGDWYELGVGDGTDSQSFTLPHNGWQHAVWVETEEDSGEYEIWHRVYHNTVNGGSTSTVFWDDIADWGNSFETGYVFYNDRTAGTITFGTSSNGGVIPDGAKVRIPNVHVGTTTTGAPTTEYVGVTVTSVLEMIDSAVTENVFIDHLNASTAFMSLVQTNGGTISDSCFGWWNATNIINKCNAAVSITNCAFVAGNGLTGDSVTNAFIIQDNVGGITIEDCVIYAGLNGNTSAGLSLLTMANILFKGRNKIPSNQQDENSHAAVRGSVASNVEFEDDLILNAAGIILIAGCVNWTIENIIWSQNTARGSTEDAMVLINSTGVDNLIVSGGRFATGSGVRHMNGSLFTITDSSNVTIRNFGAVDAKIDCGGRGTTVLSLAGITNNCLFQRLYFTNRNTADPFGMLNSCADITIENCSCDYNDELEPDANRTIMKGIHIGSGNIGASTGVEDDYVNVTASVFYDIFKSDTTGGIGLIFNPGGLTYSANITIDSGTPVWNGIGDLLMPSTSDQVTFTFPYLIKGHTGFQNALPHLIGVNCGTLGSGWGNFSIEYAIDTGSGYSEFETASGTNLSGKTISATGFGLKIRIKVTTASSTNAVNGLQIHTTTTISDQKSNLYPLSVAEVELTGLKSGSEVRAYLGTDPSTATEISGAESSGTSYSFNQSYAGQAGYIQIFALGYLPIKLDITYSEDDISIPIQQSVDRQYNNPS